MIEVLDRSSGSVVGIRLSGKVTEEDYENLLPRLKEQLAEHGEVNLVCEFDDFGGVEAEAVWEDLKFYAGHAGDFPRLAVVQEEDWQGLVARLGSLFGAEVRVFDPPEEGEAWKWIEAEVGAEASADRDARHTKAVEQRLERLVRDLRSYVDESEDPQAKALYETSAEALDGLKTAFRHYQDKAEEAWEG